MCAFLKARELGSPGPADSPCVEMRVHSPLLTPRLWTVAACRVLVDAFGKSFVSKHEEFFRYCPNPLTGSYVCICTYMHCDMYVHFDLNTNFNTNTHWEKELLVG